MMAARALFAAPCAARALAPGRTGIVELALSRGAYARLGGDWVMLAGPDVPFGPLSLVVAGLEELGVSPGWSVSTLDGWLSLGRHEVSLVRMRERWTAPLARAGPADRSAVTSTVASLRAALPTPPKCLSRGIAALTEGRVHAATDALAGLGEGLTPAGDDVLAGYAAGRLARRLLAPPDRVALDDLTPLSRLGARRCSPIGLAYLRCAERGELPDAAARLLAAISQGSDSEAQSALPALRSWGASSGTALAWGITAAFT
jgi:hypothetical protein